MRIYATAADHLQYNPYKVKVPTYSSVMLDIVESGIIQPIYNPIDEYAYQDSAITIYEMIQNMKNKIPFKIIEDIDVLRILAAIDNYLKEVRDHLDEDAYKKFIPDLLELRSSISKLKDRVLNLHPEYAILYQTLDIGYLKALRDFFLNTGRNVNGTTPMEAFGDINALNKFPSSESMLSKPLKEHIDNAGSKNKIIYDVK